MALNKPLDADTIRRAGGTTAQQARRQRLASRLRSAAGNYELPAQVPCVIEGLAQRATATAYAEGVFVAQNATVLRCIKGGTSSAAASLALSDPAYLVDNTCIWAVFGYIAPVAFANSLPLVLGQLFAANGMLFKVTVAGTTHASNPAPDSIAGGTHGTVSYIYSGPQELPVVSCAIEATPAGSFTARAGWAAGALSPNCTVRGGTPVPSTAVNPTTLALLVSASADGVAPYGITDMGAGSLLYQTDAPVFYLRTYHADFGAMHWIDGKLVAFTYAPTQFQARNFKFDATGLRRSMRNVRHKLPSVLQIASVFATAADTVRHWNGYSSLRAVLVGDSFYERGSTGTGGWLGDMLGIEDWRIAASGGTGILQPNTPLSRVNFTNRFSQDVIAHDPHLVVLALSGNDVEGIPASFTAQNVIAAAMALVDRVHNETGGEVVVIGLWNNRAPITAGTGFEIDTGVQAACAAKGVPFIPYRDLLTDGGFVGTTVGTGTSRNMTSVDGVHPSVPQGQRLRADYLVPRIIEAIEGLAS